MINDYLRRAAFAEPRHYRTLQRVAVPVQALSGRLSFFKNMKHPMAWTGRFRRSPSKWSELNGRVVAEALLKASKKPVHRPVDPKKLKLRPRVLESKRWADKS